MALTRDFKATVRERLQREQSFREALLQEAFICFLASDVDTGKSLLRDYVEGRSTRSAVSRRRHTRPCTPGSGLE